MKVFAWMLLVFSSLAVLGLFASWDAVDAGSNAIGLAYGIAVIAFTGKYLSDN